MEEYLKPDFENIASKDHNILTQDSFTGYVSGMEKIWNDYVIPANKRISDLESERNTLLNERDQLNIRVQEMENERDGFTVDFMLHYFPDTPEELVLNCLKEFKQDLK